MLRVRILQELHVLLQSMRRRPHDSEAYLLRRLTRAEWGALKKSGTIPQEDAIAVIVVPPIKGDPVTRTQPEPSMSSLPPTEPAPTKTGPRPLPAVSTLMPTSSDWFDGQLSTILPQAKVPLYNGLALFPRRVQRVSCYNMLSGILGVERKVRHRRYLETRKRKQPADDESLPRPEVKQRTGGDAKASHAFLLRSNAATLLRADTVPLAIALWRLRLWEGQGWDLRGSPEYVGPWADH